MHRHEFKKINDVRVCTKCGLTIPDKGKPFFDRKIVGYKPRKRGGSK